MSHSVPCRTLVITGCSSGFGRVTALHLAKRGCHAIAIIFFLLLFTSCGGAPPAQHATPTPHPTYPPTVCPTATVGPMETPTPEPTEAPTPCPNPTTPMPSACETPPGVVPVSPTQVNRGDTSKPQVALTFDPFGTAALLYRYLDILAKHHVQATWFPEASEMQGDPGRLVRLRDEGHEIGNHTMTHPHLTGLSDVEVCTELNQAEHVISAIIGRTTRPYFRPPYGDVDDRIRQLAANLGYRTISWTIDTGDWMADATPDKIISIVMSNISNGAIILMHTTEVGAQALDALLTRIEQRGYQMVTVGELLQ